MKVFLLLSISIVGVCLGSPLTPLRPIGVGGGPVNVNAPLPLSRGPVNVNAPVPIRGGLGPTNVNNPVGLPRPGLQPIRPAAALGGVRAPSRLGSSFISQGRPVGRIATTPLRTGGPLVNGIRPAAGLQGPF